MMNAMETPQSNLELIDSDIEKEKKNEEIVQKLISDNSKYLDGENTIKVANMTLEVLDREYGFSSTENIRQIIGNIKSNESLSVKERGLIKRIGIELTKKLLSKLDKKSGPETLLLLYGYSPDELRDKNGGLSNIKEIAEAIGRGEHEVGGAWDVAYEGASIEKVRLELSKIEQKLDAANKRGFSIMVTDIITKEEKTPNDEMFLEKNMEALNRYKDFVERNSNKIKKLRGDDGLKRIKEKIDSFIADFGIRVNGVVDIELGDHKN